MNTKEIKDLIINSVNCLIKKTNGRIGIGDSFTFKDLIPTDGSVIPTSEIAKVSRYFSKMVKTGEIFGIVKSDTKINGVVVYIRTGYRVSKRINPKNKEIGIFHDISGLRNGDIVEITYLDTLGNDYNIIKASLINNSKNPIILKEIYISQDSHNNSLYKDFIDYTEKNLYEMSLDPESEIPNIMANVYDFPITGSKQYNINIIHKFGFENSESISISKNTETYKSEFIANINEERIRHNSYIKTESDRD